MTIVDRHISTPTWVSQAELANAAGLREDLIGRFVPPAAHTSTGPMWSPHQLHLAVYVKELTEQNLPPAAIEEKVRAFISPAGDPLASYPSAPTAGKVSRSGRSGSALRLGAVALGCLIAGGLVGGLLGFRAGVNDTRAAPTFADQSTVNIPSTPDPVCPQWAAINTQGRAARAEWQKTDPSIPANQWSAEQRELNKQLVPKLQDEAAALRQLAAQAREPALATTLRIMAAYEDAYADRIPTYSPADLPLWRAATEAAALANSLCGLGQR